MRVYSSSPKEIFSDCHFNIILDKTQALSKNFF